MEVLNFEQCIKTSNERHLLLGNGFSIGFDKSFSYHELMLGIPKELNPNKESSIEGILSSHIVGSAEHTCLRKILIEGILKAQDKKCVYEKIEKQMNNCNSFLNKFTHIFTTNYDLLIYWILSVNFYNKYNVEIDGFFPDKYLKYKFQQKTELVWKNSKKQNIHYLHGAIHFFYMGEKIKKITHKTGRLRLTGRPKESVSISSQIKTYIDKKCYPIFIAEGTTQEKLKKIKENIYLTSVFSKLSTISGDLFIYGHSIDNVDDHIFDALNKNPNIKNIYVSFFNRNDYERIEYKIKIWEQEYTKNYYLYDSQTVKIWN